MLFFNLIDLLFLISEIKNSNKAAVIIDGPDAVLNCNEENNPIKIDNSPPIVEKQPSVMDC